jgi:hypothetical protein
MGVFVIHFAPSRISHRRIGAVPPSRPLPPCFAFARVVLPTFPEGN